MITKNDISLNPKRFIQKLEAIEWTKVNNGTLIDEEGLWSMRPSTKYQRSHVNNKYYIQLLLHIMYKGEIVMTWGCLKEDQSDLLGWYMRTKQKIQDMNYSTKTIAYNDGKRLWDSI